MKLAISVKTKLNAWEKLTKLVTHSKKSLNYVYIH